MTYIYALIGIAMMSGIMSMLETSLSISESNRFNEYPRDYYIDSSDAYSNDQEFLSIINKKDIKNQLIASNNLCNDIKQVIKDDGNIYLKKYNLGQETSSSHYRFSNSCVYVGEIEIDSSDKNNYSNNKNAWHRIIINKDSSNNLSYYSCIYKKSEVRTSCDFELNYR